MRKLTSLCILLLVAGIASADMTFDVVPVDNSSALAPGWVTQDLTIATDADWTVSVLILENLAPGDIYQDAMGAGCAEPNPALFGVPGLESLEFDSYVRDFVLDGTSPATAAAVDQGYTTIICDENAIAIVWYTTNTDEIGMSPLARVTLKETSNNNSWYFEAWDPSGLMIQEAGPIVDGHMVPEPMTMTLLAIGGLGALIRRRR